MLAIYPTNNSNCGTEESMYQGRYPSLKLQSSSGAGDEDQNGGNGGGDDDDGGGNDTNVIVKTKPKVKKPSLYRVLLLNDDFTPMEFVVEVLARFFRMDLEAATQVMLHVHQNGVGECGIFTYEVAETKVTQVMDHARKNQHPLQCVMEKK
jgi:ATP-dependent Clp protease adaptor protein ClpS